MHLSKFQQPILPSKLGKITCNLDEIDEKSTWVDFGTTQVTLEVAWLVCQNELGQKHVGTLKFFSRSLLECCNQQ